MPDLKTVTFDAQKWQVVPKDPTPEMLDAAKHTFDISNGGIYETMLAAAPEPAAKANRDKQDEWSAFLRWFTHATEDHHLQSARKAWQARAALSANCEKDAQRYRWLRDECGIVEYKAAFGGIGAGMLPSGQELDDAIDTYLKEAS